MKQLNKTNICILLLFSFFANANNVSAQDEEAAEPIVNLQYFVSNNSMHYLIVQSSNKVGRKFLPVAKQAIHVYLDSEDAANLLASTITDETGRAKVLVPPAFKEKWNSTPNHTFIAIAKGATPEDDLTTSLDIIKARMEIDTTWSDGVRSINVSVAFEENNEWIPANEVEMKIGVARSRGILTGGEDETYTTDSTGTVSVEFVKGTLPGDEKGNFIIVAKVEDNEQFGNLLVEKIVPWGVPVIIENNFFDQRTLWSTRDRSPWWLLLMAYSIIIGVWGTIIYLVIQLIKIKKLGTADSLK